MFFYFLNAFYISSSSLFILEIRMELWQIDGRTNTFKLRVTGGNRPHDLHTCNFKCYQLQYLYKKVIIGCPQLLESFIFVNISSSNFDAQLQTHQTIFQTSSYSKEFSIFFFIISIRFYFVYLVLFSYCNWEVINGFNRKRYNTLEYSLS